MKQNQQFWTSLNKTDQWPRCNKTLLTIIWKNFNQILIQQQKTLLVNDFCNSFELINKKKSQYENNCKIHDAQYTDFTMCWYECNSDTVTKHTATKSF